MSGGDTRATPDAAPRAFWSLTSRGSVPRSSPPALVSSWVSWFFRDSACFCCAARLGLERLQVGLLGLQVGRLGLEGRALALQLGGLGLEESFWRSRLAAFPASSASSLSSWRNLLAERLGRAGAGRRGRLPAEVGGLGEDLPLLGARVGDLAAQALGLGLQRRHVWHPVRGAWIDASTRRDDRSRAPRCACAARERARTASARWRRSPRRPTMAAISASIRARSASTRRCSARSASAWRPSSAACASRLACSDSSSACSASSSASCAAGRPPRPRGPPAAAGPPSARPRAGSGGRWPWSSCCWTLGSVVAGVPSSVAIRRGPL